MKFSFFPNRLIFQNAANQSNSFESMPDYPPEIEKESDSSKELENSQNDAEIRENQVTSNLNFIHNYPKGVDPKIEEKANQLKTNKKKAAQSILYQGSAQIEAAFSGQENDPSPFNREKERENINNTLENYVRYLNNSKENPHINAGSTNLHRGELKQPWLIDHDFDGNTGKQQETSLQILNCLPRVNSENKPKTFLIIPPPGKGKSKTIKWKPFDIAHPWEKGEFRPTERYNIDNNFDLQLLSGTIIQEIPTDQSEEIAQNTKTITQSSDQHNIDNTQIENQFSQNIISAIKIEKSNQTSQKSTIQNVEKTQINTRTSQIFQKISSDLAQLSQEHLSSEIPQIIEMDENNLTEENTIIHLSNIIKTSLRSNQEGKLIIDPESGKQVEKIIEFLTKLCQSIINKTQTKDQTSNAQTLIEPEKTKIQSLKEEDLFQIGEKEEKIETIQESDLFLNEEEIFIYKKTQAALENFRQKYLSFETDNK